MELDVIAIVAGAFVAAGFVKGVIGMGLPLTSIALMALVFELRQAVILVLVPVIVLNIYQALAGLSAWATIRRFMLFNIFACIGIFIGTRLLFELDQRILYIVLGTAMSLYVSINLFRVEIVIPPKWEKPLAPPLGFAAGVLCGATGSLAAFLVPYLQGLKITKDEFIQAVGFTFFITAAVWAVALFERGAVTWTLGTASAFALIPATIGMIGGTRLRARLAPERFRLIVFLFLLLLGLNYIRRGIFG